MSEETRTGDALADEPTAGHPRPTRGAKHAAPDPQASNGASTPSADSTSTSEDYHSRFTSRFQDMVAATEPHPTSATDSADRGRESTSKPSRARPAADRWSGWVRSIVVLAIVMLAAATVRFFVIGHYYIPSGSMEPTLHGCPKVCNDDHVLVDKVSYRAHPPRAGDIIVFDRPPADPSGESELIKRVIGQGGDTVSLRDGRVYVNGLLLNEPYVNKRCGSRPTQPLTGISTWRIPRDDVFVLGDNRCDSFDSRAFGPIKDSSVVGRAFAIVWPLSRARTL